ncbi:MAG: hypothetical protein EOP06_26215 [Proteobacteria bacterium]|nr:MAG: hypothetical protein EOP06_26215 [Pseudomonadota bacterium]
MEIHTPPDVKPKRPPGRQPKFSESYMLMVAEKVCTEGMSYREAAKQFGLSHGSIAYLVKKYNDKKFKTKRKETTSKYKAEVEAYRSDQHVRDLKLQIADLYLENLMLKKMLEHSLRKRKESSSEITSENLDLLPARVK